jgi:WD40 repeat protein
MSCHAFLTASLALLLSAAEVLSEQAPAAPDTMPPLLCLEAGGPTAAVTALAFDPTGRTLYAAGFDKVVRVWKLDEKNQRFVLEPYAYRVPIGPGTTGVINSMAVSADGRWVAASGLGVFQTGSTFQYPGKVFPIQAEMTPAMLREQGTIYLFDTTDQVHPVRVLQGHEGVVQKLAFAPGHPDKPSVLVSAAQERASKNTWVNKVRLWDVSKAALLDNQGKLVGGDATLAEWAMPGKPGQPVGLAVRHTGKEVKQVRVAIAWNDGRLRLWEPASPDLREPIGVEDGMPGGNSTAVFVDDEGLITGAVSRREGGFLQVWDDRTGQKPKSRTEVTLQRGARGLRAASALGLLSGRGNSHLDHAAVIVREVQAGGKDDYSLHVMKLAEQETVASVALWSLPNAEAKAQHLAAAPTGKYLAVAGDGSQRIRLFSIPELLKNRDAPLPDIHSVGAVIRSVAFVANDKGSELGLAVSEMAGLDPGQLLDMGEKSLVFDFAKRTLTPDPKKQGWKLNAPDLDGWKVRMSEQELLPHGKVRRIVYWKGPTEAGRVTIDLPLSETLTRYVLLPPKFSKAPLLAVASWDRVLAQPMLVLYDTATQAQVRQLKGHSQRIHALAASRDGRYLVSAAEDQTVCVWTLTDLDRNLGQHSTLSGITLKARAKNLVVEAVDEGSPASNVLKVGDTIVGLVSKDGAGLVPVRSAFEFYDGLWNQKPGAEVLLQIERDGARRNVAIKVTQGIDEQKPLLFLFVTAKREWIAWTPIGPYDASSLEAERYLGWQFNPKKFAAPVLFEGGPPSAPSCKNAPSSNISWRSATSTRPSRPFRTRKTARPRPSPNPACRSKSSRMAKCWSWRTGTDTSSCAGRGSRCAWRSRAHLWRATRSKPSPGGCSVHEKKRMNSIAKVPSGNGCPPSSICPDGPPSTESKSSCAPVKPTPSEPAGW